jgi:GDP-L-fucose synthase
MDWSKKRVLVTGGAGFLGAHVVEALRGRGCGEIFVARVEEYDLTREENVERLYRDARPQVVIHLAGLVGGIMANKLRPADFFWQNLTMGSYVLHHAWRSGGVEKFVAAAAGCGYPEHAPIPLREESFWDGFPQHVSAPYSIAKKLLHIQSMAYRAQHGFKSIVVLPGNLYGPHDNFSLEDAHVVPALVRKFVTAADDGLPEVTVWGSGKPTRDFIYARDVADGMLLALERHDDSTILNLSSGVETSISELCELCARLCGFKGKVVWDTSRPDGQLRRWFDIGRARREIGYEPRHSLERGLQLTIDWFRANRKTARL